MPNFTLKQTLIADGITCTGLFLLGVFATATVAGLLGLPVTTIAVAGWIGLPSALLMFFVVSQQNPSRALANFIAVGNFLWVAASVVVLALYAQSMSTLGIIVVAAQALVVLEFAIFEWRGAKKLAQPAAVFS